MTLLDYTIVSQKDRREVRVTRNMCGPPTYRIRNEATSHQITKETEHLKMLKNNLVKQKLVEESGNKIPLNTNLYTDVDAEWDGFRDAVCTAASEVVGHITRKHHWFDDKKKLNLDSIGGETPTPSSPPHPRRKPSAQSGELFGVNYAA